MAPRDLIDIDRDLDSLGEVPAQLSQIIARYGAVGLDIDEVDGSLKRLVEKKEIIHYSTLNGFAPPDAEEIEVFHDDVDERVARPVFIKAESRGLIQRTSAIPVKPEQGESDNPDEQAEVEYVEVSTEELSAAGDDLAFVKHSQSDKQDVVEFVDDASREFGFPSDGVSAEDEAEQRRKARMELEDAIRGFASDPFLGNDEAEQRRKTKIDLEQVIRGFDDGTPKLDATDFDAVYTSDIEGQVSSTDESRSHGDDEPSRENSRSSHPGRVDRDRNPFRDSEYKRLLDLELDPSEFPQSEPPSRRSSMPAPVAEAQPAEIEALDDDDLVEIPDDDA
jgi:hypothetical protein